MTEGEIRAAVAARYEPLRRILTEHASELIRDFSPFENAIQGVRVNPSASEWQLALHDFTLHLDAPPRGAFPSGLGSFHIRLSVEFTVNVRAATATTPEDLFGELTVLQCQVSLDGVREGNLHRAAWHLDLHSYGSAASKELHPRIHWQHGGKAARDWNSNVGDWLLTAAPRLPAPPVDLALSLAWLLGQFVPHHWDYIKQVDTEILQLLRLHQAWLWEPYFARIISHWSPTPDAMRLEWWPELV